MYECEHCHKEIKSGEPTFARVEEYGDRKFRSDGITAYRLKNYTRFQNMYILNLFYNLI